MGKRSKRYEEEMRLGKCDLCDNDICIDFYYDRGDTIFCDDCSAEYLIKCRQPLRLILLDEEYDDDFYGDLDFD